MAIKISLQCTNCNNEFEIMPIDWICPICKKYGSITFSKKSTLLFCHKIWNKKEFIEIFINSLKDPYDGRLVTSSQATKLANDKRSYVDDMFERSKHDLRKSKQLLEIVRKDNDHDYSDVIQYLGKSIEKESKGFGVMMGLISTGEVIDKIGHFSPMVFKNIFREPPLDKITREVANGLGLPYISASEYSKRYKKYLRHPNELISGMSYLHISHVLYWCRKFKEWIKEDLFKNNDLQITDDVLDLLENKVKPFFDIPENIDDDFLVNTLLNMSVSMFSLILLSELTWIHKYFTDFPDGLIKPNNYDENMGIVKIIDELIKEAELTLNDIIAFTKLSK